MAEWSRRDGCSVSIAFRSRLRFPRARKVAMVSHVIKPEMPSKMKKNVKPTAASMCAVRFNHCMICAPVSTPAIVPTTMIPPNFKSTLPSVRCLRAATIDLPTMCARSVPTTKFIGTPAANRAGPAEKLPPTPKKPPRIPTTNPTPIR